MLFSQVPSVWFISRPDTVSQLAGAVSVSVLELLSELVLYQLLVINQAFLCVLAETHFEKNAETHFKSGETHFKNSETHFNQPKNSFLRDFC